MTNGEEFREITQKFHRILDEQNSPITHLLWLPVDIAAKYGLKSGDIFESALIFVGLIEEDIKNEHYRTRDT